MALRDQSLDRKAVTKDTTNSQPSANDRAQERTGGDLPAPEHASDPRQWVELHGDAMFRFAMMRVRSREIAEEAVQEAFLAALAARANFDGRSSERTWLIGILRFKLIDLLRRRQRESERNLAVMPESEALFDHGIWIRRPKNWNAVELDLESREFRQVLTGCIEALPSPMREAFCLRVLDGIPTDDVCKTLGVRPTNLWTLVHRAKLKLRTCLTVRWFGGGDA